MPRVAQEELVALVRAALERAAANGIEVADDLLGKWRESARA